jgi:N-acetylglutamate synthase-like GNAT family acetyltransferase
MLKDMQVQVRVAGRDDAGLISEVLVASYPVLMAGAYDAPLLERALPLMTRANPKMLESGTYYVAEIDGEPVGCGGWTFEEPGSGTLEAGVAHIRHFGVSEHFVGRGVGRALFDRCLVEAQRSGVRQMECYSSLNGEPFYSALGYSTVRFIDVQMGAELVFSSIHMRRMI